MHGASITRHDLAMAMQWELARVERALRALEVRLAGTGLRLPVAAGTATASPQGQGSCRAKRQNNSGSPTVGRAPLEGWAAALLSHIITGVATGGLNEDVPEPYRSTGIDVLIDRGLITHEAWLRRRHRPSGDVERRAARPAIPWRGSHSRRTDGK